VQAPTAAEAQVAQQQRLWAECAGAVLQTVAGAPVVTEPETEEAANSWIAEAGKPGVWARFATGKGLHGECALFTGEAGAVQLAQALMSEPADAAASYDEGRQEAYAELLRQIAGQVASGLKASVGREVSLSLVASDAPNWPVAGRFGIRIGGEKLGPIHLVGAVSGELAEALGGLSNSEKKEEGKQNAEKQKVPEQKARTQETVAIEEESPAVSAGSNLELLLDVKLSATIRFGRRRMLLREILEIHPGAAIELDRHVQEPVELLVGGRVIARGEVVIADGNYGLRITEIVSPRQRIASLGE
jgi:flagellar motor switch protein FliN/FliY